MKKIIFTGVTGLLLVACKPTTVEAVKEDKKEVTEAAVEFPNATVAEGSTLYVENCGSCHKLKPVKNYTTERWAKIVPPMAKKAKIDSEKEAKILAYVTWQTQN